MGGAVATIVAIFAMLEEKKREGFEKKRRAIKCFTFGAPMVGDADLQKVIFKSFKNCLMKLNFFVLAEFLDLVKLIFLIEKTLPKQPNIINFL